MAWLNEIVKGCEGAEISMHPEAVSGEGSLSEEVKYFGWLHKMVCARLIARCCHSWTSCDAGHDKTPHFPACHAPLVWSVC